MSTERELRYAHQKAASAAGLLSAMIERRSGSRAGIRTSIEELDLAQKCLQRLISQADGSRQDRPSTPDLGDNQ